MRISFTADDRLLAGAGGTIAGLAGLATAAYLMRGTARVQAARSALLGRPTAYRLHLHGTGLEFASWERNYVGECVLRGWPENGIKLSPDVKPRPDQGGGSVFRDSMFIGNPRMPGHTGVRFDSGIGDDPEPPPADEDDGDGLSGDGLDPEEDDEMADTESRGLYVPAVCVNGHNYPAVKYAILHANASIAVSTPVVTDCPECGAHGAVYPGRYFILDGRVVREDIPAEPDDS